MSQDPDSPHIRNTCVKAPNSFKFTVTNNPLETAILYVAIAAIALLTAGCAPHPTGYVNSLVEKHGFHDVNGIFYREETDEVGSTAAVSGSPRERMELDKLFLRETLELGPVQVSVHTASERMSPSEGRILSAVSEGSEVRAALSSALIETVGPMTRIMSKGLQIQLIVVPNRSGFFITLLSDRETSPIPLAFLAPVFPEHELGADSIQSFWVQQAAMISHELLHLEHELVDLETTSKLEKIDEETAASLMNWCTEARFSQAMNSSSTNFSGRHIGLPSARNFPGLFRGEFSPNEKRLQSAGHTSSVGKKVARAIVFHLVADGARTINLADPETTAPLYALCDKLPANLPRFTRGEIP